MTGETMAPPPLPPWLGPKIWAIEPPRIAALVVVESEPDAAPSEQTDRPEQTTDAAARRRAVFKVIDGGR